MVNVYFYNYVFVEQQISRLFSPGGKRLLLYVFVELQISRLFSPGGKHLLLYVFVELQISRLFSPGGKHLLLYVFVELQISRLFSPSGYVWIGGRFTAWEEKTAASLSLFCSHHTMQQTHTEVFSSQAVNVYHCMCLLHRVMLSRIPSTWSPSIPMYVFAAQELRDSLQVVTVYTSVCVCCTGWGCAGIKPQMSRLFPISGLCLYLCMCCCRIPSKWSPSIPLYVFAA